MKAISPQVSLYSFLDFTLVVILQLNSSELRYKERRGRKHPRMSLGNSSFATHWKGDFWGCCSVAINPALFAPVSLKTFSFPSLSPFNWGNVVQLSLIPDQSWKSRWTFHMEMCNFWWGLGTLTPFLSQLITSNLALKNLKHNNVKMIHFFRGSIVQERALLPRWCVGGQVYGLWIMIGLAWIMASPLCLTLCLAPQPELSHL